MSHKISNKSNGMELSYREDFSRQPWELYAPALSFPLRVRAELSSSYPSSRFAMAPQVQDYSRRPRERKGAIVSNQSNRKSA